MKSRTNEVQKIPVLSLEEDIKFYQVIAEINVELLSAILCMLTANCITLAACWGHSQWLATTTQTSCLRLYELGNSMSRSLPQQKCRALDKCDG